MDEERVGELELAYGLGFGHVQHAFFFSCLIFFVLCLLVWLVLAEQGFVMDKIKIDDLSAADRQDEGFLKPVPTSVPPRRLFSSFIPASETRICKVL